MRYVADECRRLRAAAAIELHFNSGPPTARGHEWLYWHSSSKARSLAEGLRAEFEADFPELPARGAKARSPADRGAAFLRLVPCPAVIAEPFFGSNADDWTWAAAHRPQMALAMARALVSWRGQK
jgi:N-acetylmuramoyl-L-alanine amidase